MSARADLSARAIVASTSDASFAGQNFQYSRLFLASRFFKRLAQGLP
jgi:hypothetical protein